MIVCDKASASPPTSSNPADHSLSYTAPSATPFGNTVYIIAIDAIQTKETEKKVVITM